MIFVDNIQDLQYYNASSQWGCYGDAVFNPSDILLQANGFTLTTTAITVVINICDTAGTFQEVGTSYFDIYFGSYMLGGVTYYFVNVKANDYSPFMVSNRCFIVEVIITEGSTEFFHKWTQKYQIVSASATPPVFIPYIVIDDVDTAPCVPGENPALCSEGGEQHVTFASTFDCLDYYTGDYYDVGTTITGTPFAFSRFSHLEARFRDIPTEVERVISINNRTQKTAYTGQYLLSGNVVFPVWKMKEIQNMLRGNKLYIDGTEFQSVGGKVFEQTPGIPVNCVYMYKLAITFQDPFQWQIFGCVPSCAALADFYMFPEAFERVYDDSMMLIGTTPDEVKIYFEGITGTSSVEELPFIAPCPVYSLFRVISSGVLPKFLYVDAPIPAQRIFPKRLSVSATDMTPLCNGVTNNNQVPIPDITGENDEQIVVAIPDITGEDDVDANQYYPAITAAQQWTIDSNYSNAVNYAGEGTLNMQWTTDVYTSPFTNMILGNIEAVGRPSRDILITSTNNGNMPPASTLLIGADGNLTYNGEATSVQMNTKYIELFNIKYPL